MNDKKRLWIMTLALVYSSLSLFAQNLSMNLRNVTVNKAMAEFRQQSGYSFVYEGADLNTEKNITVYAANLTQAIQQILAGQNVTYKIKGKNVIVSKTTSHSVPQQKSEGQKPHKISGTIKDRNGEAIIGASIKIKGTGQGVVSDVSGNFVLDAPENSSLEISYIGYLPQTIHTGNRSEINIMLSEDNKNLDEIVVVGYRTVKKISLTGSVATIDAERKANQPITNSTQMLYNTPGLWVNQGGAKPGVDNANITIRGVNSLNSTGGAPLVLLDGVEYSINEIDPATIESISVLKDVSAAIYGLKAANGVILITSKKGRKGRPKIEYRTKFGIQTPTYLPNVVTDPIAYMRLRNLAEMNSGVAPGAVSYTDDQIYEYMDGMKNNPDVYPASDWFNICMRNGFMQQHNARVSGGIDAVTYTVGLGYTGQTGVFIKNDDAARYSFDMKLNAHIAKGINLSGTVQGNIRNFNEMGYGTSTILSTVMRGLPIFSDYHKDGKYGSTWVFTPGRNNVENPRMEVEQGITYRNFQELLATVGTDVKLAPHLKYYATLGFRRIDHFSKNFIPLMYTINPKTGDVKQFNNSAPRLKEFDAVTNQYTVSHRLVWENNYQKHDIHVMIGQDWQHNGSSNFQAYNEGFNDNTLDEFDALANQTLAKATGSSSRKRINSFYGRLAYTFNECYLLEGTLRYDGSSNLSRERRWEWFPSIMAGWNISREKFFKIKQIDLLKLRASYGIMGSESVEPYSYYMTYRGLSQNYSFANKIAGGYAITDLIDPNLGWEKTSATNIGIDLMAFNGKLNVELDYFNKRTYDIIMSRTVPAQLGGLSGPKTNVGTVRNRGFEASVSWRQSLGDFHYGVQGSVCYVKNKVISLNGSQIISSDNVKITKEGYPIRSYYVYQADGFYQNQSEIDNASAVYGNKASLRPGYIRYADNHVDGIIDDKDKIITKNSIPELTYSFGMSCGWKGITLEAQFQGVGSVYAYLKDNLAYPFNNGAGVTMDWATNSWTPQNPGAKLPLLTTATNATQNFIPSTQWLYNCAYLRLKNIQLTYSLPQKLIAPLHATALQLYISAQNLWTLSGFKLWDPEITSTRTNLYEYPNLKTFSFGLNFTF